MRAIQDSSAFYESCTSREVEVLAELTQDEQRDRTQLELGIEQAFIQAGKARVQLRQRRLYRSTHDKFEAYCQDRFGFTRRHSDDLIAGAVVGENLPEMRTIPSQILPKVFSQLQA